MTPIEASRTSIRSKGPKPEPPAPAATWRPPAVPSRAAAPRGRGHIQLVDPVVVEDEHGDNALGATVAAGDNVGGCDAGAVLDNWNVALRPACRCDLLDGIIDQRVIDFLARQRGHVAVSVLKTGHSQFLAGKNCVSKHWDGRTVDLYAGDGVESRPHETCRAFVEEVVALAPADPARWGQPRSEMAGAGGWSTFTGAVTAITSTSAWQLDERRSRRLYLCHRPAACVNSRWEPPLCSGSRRGCAGPAGRI